MSGPTGNFFGLSNGEWSTGLKASAGALGFLSNLNRVGTEVAEAGWKLRTAEAMSPYYQESARLEAASWKEKERTAREQALILERNAHLAELLGENRASEARLAAAIVRDRQAEQARQVRRQGEVEAAARMVGFLKSGVRLEGTPGRVLDNTLILAEEQALDLIEQGEIDAARTTREAEVKQLQAGAEALDYRLKARQSERSAELAAKLGPLQAYKIELENWRSRAGAETAAYQARSGETSTLLGGIGQLLSLGGSLIK